MNRTGLELIELYDEQYTFTSEDICNIHELWLGEIYPFAGKYRTVMLSKNNFPFATPQRIPALMNQFEQNILSAYTPTNIFSEEDLAYALAVVHVELIIIHPFCE